MPILPITWADRGIRILDQTRLPDEELYVELSTIADVAEAIAELRVRGAPLIGITAAMGLAAVAARHVDQTGDLTREWIERAALELERVRPTAVNLRWALDRMRRAAAEAFEAQRGSREIATALRSAAQWTWDLEAEACLAIGQAGADLLEPGSTVLTHCNTGRLATGGLGTALAAVYVAHEQGKGIDVVATETRPLRQGARLTAWELSKAGVPCRVIVDGAAGSLMAAGEIDVVITGADRIAANGDTANKIGTYSLAVLAAAHGIPFYIAAPSSTVDCRVASGDGIPIEFREPGELATASGAEVVNPAFDVTPAELITAIVTDAGVLRPPLEEAIGRVCR